MAPPAAIWLVRHAPTAWTGVRYCGRADPPLSARGVAAARALATELARRLGGPPTIVTSPARRARATASAIHAAAGGPAPRLEERLLEVDFGSVEGRTWLDVEGAFPDLAAAVRAGRPVDWPGGETDRSVRRRATAFWRRAVEGETDEPLVVVSHGVVIRALLDAAGLAGEDGVLPAASAVKLAPATGGWLEADRLDAATPR